MNELLKINQSIADLQHKAKLLVSKGRADAILEIRSQMAAYGISFKDITSAFKKTSKNIPSEAKKLAKPAKEKKASVKIEPRYKGPDGQLWSGRGLSPKWLKAAELLGQSKENFLIVQVQDVPPVSDEESNPGLVN